MHIKAASPVPSYPPFSLTTNELPLEVIVISVSLKFFQVLLPTELFLNFTTTLKQVSTDSILHILVQKECKQKRSTTDNLNQLKAQNPFHRWLWHRTWKV